MPMFGANTTPAGGFIRGAVILGMALAATVTLFWVGGCTRVGQRRGGAMARIQYRERLATVQITGEPVTPGRLTALDIENPWGDVEVYVDPDKYETAHIKFEYDERWLLYAKGMKWRVPQPWFTAEHVVGDKPQTSVLRVRSTGVIPDGLDERPTVDLKIYTPVADGVRVVNAGGNVDLVGVRGALTVLSGDTAKPGGRIEVRAAEAVQDPVALVSTSGHVTLVAPPRSRGVVDIEGEPGRGRAVFNGKYGVVRDVEPRSHSWNGVLNGGTNPIILRTEHGHARLHLVPAPIRYTTGIFWPDPFYDHEIEWQ